MDDGQRVLPTSELDLNMMLTNPVWGTQEVTQEFKLKAPLWDLLNMWKRDARLGNLSEWNGELPLCRYMFDLSGDLLASGYSEPFIIALSRPVNILETSQSKHGFLRKQMNTITQKHETRNLDPPKKQFFGGGKDKNNGGY